MPTFDCVLGVLEVAEVLLEDEGLARPHGVLGEDEELHVVDAALKGVHVRHLEVRTQVRHLRLQLVPGVDLHQRRLVLSRLKRSTDVECQYRVYICKVNISTFQMDITQYVGSSVQA